MSQLFTPHASYSSDDIRQYGDTLLNGPDQSFSPAFRFAQKWLQGTSSFIFHTSGSTGIPKEVLLTRGQMEASAKATIGFLKLSAADHILVTINTQFIGGAMLLARGLMAGARITLMEPAGDPLKSISSVHPYTLASFVPMQLHSLLNGDPEMAEKINRFKRLLIGGGAIHPKLAATLASLEPEIYHTYGMTETVSHIALKLLGTDTCFYALPGVELATDERDCLKIKSAATNGQWIQTNDMVKLVSPGVFDVLGRADEIINTGGIKVFPLKIELAMRQVLEELALPDINLFVSWQEDEQLGQKIIAVFEGQLPEKETGEKILPALRKKLFPYEIPKAFFFTPSFALTPSGKIDKSETLKMIQL